MAHAFDFSGRIALVTGSSRGIGAGIVGGLNAGGARCVVVYVEDVDGRNRSEAEVVAAGLDRPLVVQCDVGDEVQVEAMVRRVGE
ncbi:MAG TPA: SDR family NAD(P)-dependent oxidoreductase, partial [Tepidisphaeraceae bacterium]